MPGSRGLSEIAWGGYCVLKDQPSNNAGVKKWLGACLYIAFFAVACVLSAQWFLDEDAATYTKFEKILQSPRMSPQHRLPDLIICPSEREHQKYKYNAQYFNGMVDKVLAMPPVDVDELTEMVYEACPENKDCQPLDQPCEGTKFAKYCEIIKTKILGSDKPQYSGMAYSLRRAILTARGKKEKKMSLWTLFASILMHRQTAVPFLNLTNEEIRAQITYDENTKKGYEYIRFGFPMCHFYDYNIEGIYDNERNAQCESSSKILWIGKTLCTVTLGHAVTEFTGPFAGFGITGEEGIQGKDANRQMQSDYWMGNLDVTSLDESQFVTNTPIAGQGKPQSRMSGVVNYRMIKMYDEADLGKTCAPQPLLRGLKLPCRGEADNVWWYYIFQFQPRPLNTIWTYPKSLDYYVRKPTFTNYGRFQLAVGMFGCMVGLSLMQLIEFFCLLMIWMKPVLKRATEIFQVMAALGMIGFSLYMSISDTQDYIKNRYASEFLVRNSEFPLPKLRLCNNPTLENPTFSFINVTKLTQHGVSPALYHYFLHAVWRQAMNLYAPYISRGINISGTVYQDYPMWMFTNWNPKPQLPWPCTQNYYKYHNPTTARLCYFPSSPLFLKLINFKHTRTGKVSQKESEEYLKEIANEAKVVYQKMGFNDRIPALYEVFNYFNLDPKNLIKTCQLGQFHIPNCEKYTKYVMEGSSFGMCIEITIPRKAVPTGATMLGLYNGLKISFDTELFRKDSDLNMYVGPGLEDLVAEHKNDTQCFLLSGNKMINSWQRPKMSKQFENKNITYMENAPYLRGCGRSNSWLLKLSHPQWSDTHIQLRISNDGLMFRSHYAIDISDGFEEEIEREGNECVLEERVHCRAPMETIENMIRSLLHQKLCGCMGCYHKDPESERLLAEVVPGYKCCTPEDHWNCYLKLQAKLRWNATSKQYENKEDPRNGYTAIFVENRAVPYLNIRENLEAIRKMSAEDMGKTLFKETGPLDEDIIKRLRDTIQKCSRTPCKRKFLSLNSLQTLETVPGQWIANIFYGKDKVLGRIDVDVLEPTSAIAVFICGYSVTFGISLLGILHIIVTSLSGGGPRAPVSFESVMNRLHGYWLRTMGAVLVTRKNEQQVAPAGNSKNENSGKSTNQRRARNQSGDNGVFIEERDIDPQHTQGTATVSKMNPKMENANLSHAKNGPQIAHSSVDTTIEDGNGVQAHEPAKVSQRNTKNIDDPNVPENSNRNSNAAVDVENAKQNEMIRPGGNIKPKESPEVAISPPSSGGNKAKSGQEINQEDNPGPRESRIMLSLLAAMLMLIATLILLFYFLTNFYTFSADIVTMPTYQRPSLFLCGRNKVEFDDLTKALDSGDCRLKTEYQLYVHGCMNIFKTFIKTKAGRLCWLFDNSHEWKQLNDVHAYLTVTIPKSIEPLFEVASLNGSSLEKFEPFRKWERSSMLIDFSITQRKLIKNCEMEVERKRCDLCPPNLNEVADASACCTQRDMMAPAFVDGLPCNQFEFSRGISLPKDDPKQKTKTLSLKPTDLSMVVMSGKLKHNFYSIFSIVGGLMGTFLGLDLLNIMSHALFSLMEKLGLKRKPK